MLKIMIVVCMFAMSACASLPKHTTVKQRDVKVTLIYPAKLPDKNGLPQLARTTVGDGFCVIELAKYPQCLAHEMRHCFEFDWHSGRETTANC